MMTSLEATSRGAMRPSGDTLDLVIPGILRVVAGARVRGVLVPEESTRIGALGHVSHLHN
jgi:hypothetical protein